VVTNGMMIPNSKNQMIGKNNALGVTQYGQNDGWLLYVQPLVLKVFTAPLSRWSANAFLKGLKH
jgi:hypothetical protein